MDRKQLIVCTVTAAVLFVVGSLPARAANLGKFAWQFDPFCDQIVLQVTEENGVFAVHGFDDLVSVCGIADSEVPALHGTANPGPAGTIDLGFNFTASGFASHIFAVLDANTLSGPWTDEFGVTGTLIFLGPAPIAESSGSSGSGSKPSYLSNRNK